MEIYLFILSAISILLIFLSFVIGLHYGSKVSKGNEIEIPIPHPINAIQEHKEKREADKMQDKFTIMAENIDNYDGTGLGQKSIPR